MEYNGFYVIKFYSVDYSAIDEQTNEHCPNLKVACELYSSRDTKGIRCIDTISFSVGQDIASADDEVVNAELRKYIDNNFPRLFEEREEVNGEYLLDYADLLNEVVGEASRAVYYCREYMGKTNLKRQYRHCFDHISTQPRWKLVAAYTDHSGHDPLGDPASALNVMLEKVDQHEVDVIVVNSVTDLASNVHDLVHIFGRMYFADCHILFLEESLDNTQVDVGLFEELYRTLIPEATERYPLPSGF